MQRRGHAASKGSCRGLEIGDYYFGYNNFNLIEVTIDLKIS
jgi:hypothetical protein